MPRYARNDGALQMTYRITLDFLLYPWLDAKSLNQHRRFAVHSRETSDATKSTAISLGWLGAVETRDPTCSDFPEEAF
ncbi:MAG: hypothetical protein A3E79_01075 [Burkholderiales bacterium RIFCSPHIGHO2_12_FULL_61_11]|nr:MAG: hypothetical protein A3E79_01075 [Burkholderiales bacterium RIFCSPHIGHO2_12_FULL_61_11]